MAGIGLTPEQRAEVEAAARRPYTYDPDCPLLTEAQLAEFRPVHFATMEERAEAMRKAGIVDPATQTQAAARSQSPAARPRTAGPRRISPSRGMPVPVSGA